MTTVKLQKADPVEIHERADTAVKFHDAFMQCPQCCNCTFQCSHYGNGHFDPQGNYLGPLKGNR